MHVHYDLHATVLEGTILKMENSLAIHMFKDTSPIMKSYFFCFVLFKQKATKEQEHGDDTQEPLHVDF